MTGIWSPVRPALYPAECPRHAEPHSSAAPVVATDRGPAAATPANGRPASGPSLSAERSRGPIRSSFPKAVASDGRSPCPGPPPARSPLVAPDPPRRRSRSGPPRPFADCGRRRCCSGAAALPISAVSCIAVTLIFDRSAIRQAYERLRRWMDAVMRQSSSRWRGARSQAYDAHSPAGVMQSRQKGQRLSHPLNSISMEGPASMLSKEKAPPP